MQTSNNQENHKDARVETQQFGLVFLILSLFLLITLILSTVSGVRFIQPNALPYSEPTPTQFSAEAIAEVPAQVAQVFPPEGSREIDLAGSLR